MEPTYSPEPHPDVPEELPRRRRGLRVVAEVVGALVLVAGSGLAGLAIGHAESGNSSSGRQPGSSGQGAPFGQYFRPRQAYGSQGLQTATTSTASATQIAGLVRIQTSIGYQDAEGAGTGMILTSDGEVLTNRHVVEGATTISATVMSTGRTYAATVVGTDAKADVAVIRLSGARGLSTVRTDTVLPARGDKVTAVGDANGISDHLTASPGAVSAVGRTITTSGLGDESSETLHNLIEFSAGVVGGDSGGALYDSQGEVVGMTTAAATDRAVGYAIPIRTALTIASDLGSHVTKADYTYGRPAFMGVALATSGAAATTTIDGVYSGTPAARAGLVAGDTITRVGSTRVATASQLRKAVAAHSPGDAVTITYTGTDGRAHVTTVTLTEGPVS